mmetsp:Transcript_15338/g.43481  ORF Transcript_15338/g.43481 Transcript_15338/m.43481 type:complete len:96 (+) Transcript_15338:276-563(+)
MPRLETARAGRAGYHSLTLRAHVLCELANRGAQVCVSVHLKESKGKTLTSFTTSIIDACLDDEAPSAGEGRGYCNTQESSSPAVPGEGLADASFP